MQEEIWKDIQGYEGIYEVSNMGNVRNAIKGNCLAHKHNNRGYHTVALYKNGVCSYYLIHRLVAFAFVENPKNKKTVNHIDEDKNNNCASNLEWLTHKENDNYGTRNARWLETRTPYIKEIHNKIGETQTQCHVEQLTPNGELVKEWRSVTDIGNKLGYTRQCIKRRCVENDTSLYKGYIWRYADSERRNEASFFNTSK